jgi:hypothetical protein
MSLQPLISPREEIVSTMIDLARLSRLHRIVIAGNDSTEFYLALKRRGFAYPVLASSCRIPCGQHSAGLIAGGDSFETIEAAVVRIARFLDTTANIAVSIEPHTNGLGAKVRDKLQQLGFRIEAGARCREGFVLAAHRQDFRHDFGAVAKVA